MKEEDIYIYLIIVIAKDRKKVDSNNVLKRIEYHNKSILLNTQNPIFYRIEYYFKYINRIKTNFKTRFIDLNYVIEYRIILI